jgi:hypothetical protein
MKRFSPFYSIPFEKFSTQYILGILHTYATLNEPESTLEFIYDIVEIEKKSENLLEVIKNKIEDFSYQPFSLKLIEPTAFKQILEEWLFMEISTIKKKTQKVENFFNMLKEVTLFEKVYSIDGLSSDYEKINTELGVCYEYLVLESEKSLYLLCFSYTD